MSLFTEEADDTPRIFREGRIVEWQWHVWQHGYPIPVFIYKGQVVGEHSRDNDLEINLIKGKKLTNMRSAGADDKLKIAPAQKFSLEEALEYIQSDEYVEVTPESLRIRKIFLKEHERKKAGKAMA